MTEFDSVAPPLGRALVARGYTELTPVQTAMLGPRMTGADALVSAQTGSGKTVAFGIAIAPTLLGDAERFADAGAPLALAIAPTRELALQVRRELEWLYAETGASIASCVGGMDMRTERQALARGAHIVVATPGRLRDHITRGSLDMASVRAIVLDEADEMLDLGFREDLEFILGCAPADRRTLMFSATVPKAIATLAQNYQRHAVRIEAAGSREQHGDIEYRALTVLPRDRENAIINVLRYYEAPNALVFCSTRVAVTHLTARLSNRGFAVVALSGELSQSERTHALQAMRDGRARVCVATDVAARGIDLPNLELVVHADMPTNSETLLHRSGRTGRAGRKGTSVLIVPVNARRRSERLLQGANLVAEWARPPSIDEVSRRDDERVLAHPLLSEPAREDEQALVGLLAERNSNQQLAAALVRLLRAGQSAPEELADEPSPAATGPTGERPPREGNRDFGPSVWFSLSVGRRQNAEPRWLLPMLCRAGKITRSAIGAIRMQQEETFVEIAKAEAGGFQTALGAERMLEGGIRVTQLTGVPESAPRSAKPPRKGFDAAHKPHRKGQRDAKPPHAAGESYTKPGKPAGGAPYAPANPARKPFKKTKKRKDG